MNILMINYEYPPLGGGSSTAIYNIANKIVSMKHKVLVLTSHFKGLNEIDVKQNLTIYRVKCLRKSINQSNPLEMLSFIIQSLKKIDQIICEFKPNTTIAFFTIPSGFIALYIKLIYKIPYIISLRGGDVPGFQKKELFFYHFFSYPIILTIWYFAKYIVANSKGLKNLAQKTAFFINRKVLIIPNGIDSFKFKFTRRFYYKKLINLLYVGRVSKQKNLETLLQAILLINKKRGNIVRCDIVGDGPEKNKLINLSSKLNLTKVVSFCGWIDRKNIIKKYKSADIFISPSLYEGMSNSILEAMACGIPVIVSNIESNKHLIKNKVNGLLFTQEKPESLAHQIINLYDNKQYIYYLSQNAKNTINFFTWQNTALKYYRLLQKICNIE